VGLPYEPPLSAISLTIVGNIFLVCLSERSFKLYQTYDISHQEEEGRRYRMLDLSDGAFLLPLRLVQLVCAVTGFSPAPEIWRRGANK
jgi:hypothetical protein